MCSLEARAPWKNFGMRYLLSDGCDLKGGRKEVVSQMGEPKHEASVYPPMTSRALRYTAVLELSRAPLDPLVFVSFQIKPRVDVA